LSFIKENKFPFLIKDDMATKLIIEKGYPALILFTNSSIKENTEFDNVVKIFTQ